MLLLEEFCTSFVKEFGIDSNRKIAFHVLCDEHNFDEETKSIEWESYENKKIERNLKIEKI